MQQKCGFRSEKVERVEFGRYPLNPRPKATAQKQSLKLKMRTRNGVGRAGLYVRDDHTDNFGDAGQVSGEI